MVRCLQLLVSQTVHKFNHVRANAMIAADESLKFWKVFERKAGTSAAASREGGVGGKGGQMAKQMTIR